MSKVNKVNKLSFEAKLMLGKNNQRINMEKFKRKRKTDVRYIMDFNFDDINIVKDESEFKEFKELEIEERLLYIDDFCTSNFISDEIKKELCDIIQGGKLKNKTELNYDKINKKIYSIKILTYNEQNKEFILNKN